MVGGGGGGGEVVFFFFFFFFCFVAYLVKITYTTGCAIFRECSRFLTQWCPPDLFARSGKADFDLADELAVSGFEIVRRTLGLTRT